MNAEPLTHGLQEVAAIDAAADELLAEGNPEQAAKARDFARTVFRLWMEAAMAAETNSALTAAWRPS